MIKAIFILFIIWSNLLVGHYAGSYAMAEEIDAIWGKITSKEKPANTPKMKLVEEESDLNIEGDKIQVKRRKKEKDLILLAKLQAKTPEEEAVGAQIMFRVKNLLMRTKHIGIIMPHEIEDIKIPPVLMEFEDFRKRNIDYIITGKIIMNFAHSERHRVVIRLMVWDIYEKANILEHEFITYTDELSEFTKELSTQIYEFITGDYPFLYGKLLYTWKPVGRINAFKKVVLSQKIDGEITAKILTDGKNITFNPRYCKFQHEVLYAMQTPVNGTRLFVINRLNGRTAHLHIPFEALGWENDRRKIIFSPDFSSDCSKILFSISKDGSTNIYLFDMHIGAVKKLTNSKSIETSAKFFDGDKKIVFISDRKGRPGMWVMNANGKGAKPLKLGSLETYFAPTVSHDSKKIAFVKIKDRKFHLGIMNTDGSAERILYSAFLIENPRFTPIGRTILFSMKKNEHDKSKIYSISPNSLDLEEMPGLIGDLNEPLWVDEF